MRLWTVHPKYLDAAGLVALWREGLLARAVLSLQTRGYRSHPQLIRFRNHPRPIAAINAYLAAVYEEGKQRGYRFDGRKLAGSGTCEPIPETDGQLAFEWGHLLNKLQRRQPGRMELLSAVSRPDAHPLFRIVSGPVQAWERGA